MRLIRKWYFKIYHLLKLLGIFILIFGIEKNVYAETLEPSIIECSKTRNLFNEVWHIGYRANYSGIGRPLVFQERQNTEVSNYIKVKKNTNYTLSSNYGNRYTAGYIFVTDSNFNYTGTTVNLITVSGNNISEITFNTGNTGEYLTVYLAYNPNIEEENSYMQIEEGESKTEYIEWRDCSSVEPPTPEPEESIYSGFLTLYTDKLTYLAEGFTSNPYLKAMIGIIFAWIVLELFLKILNIRGGKR